MTDWDRIMNRTVGDLLKEGTAFLKEAPVDTPYLDALLLLTEVLSVSKERLLGRLQDPVPEVQVGDFHSLLKDRAAGKPVSYIRRRKEFYGLEFYVDERVLVPRPDTETLLEEALALVRADPRLRRVLDLGTGSGCLAVTLARNEPGLEITGADISPAAGEVFRMNAERLLGRRLPFVCSDLFAEITEPYDLVVTNPPYIPRGTVATMKQSGWPEPALALDGGPDDGTAIPRRIIRQARARLTPGGWLCMELSSEQAEKLLQEMENQGYINIALSKDLAGRDRVIKGRQPPS